MTMSRSEAARVASFARSYKSRSLGGQRAAETRGYESLAEAGRKGGQHAHDKAKLIKRLLNSFVILSSLAIGAVSITGAAYGATNSNSHAYNNSPPF